MWGVEAGWHYFPIQRQVRRIAGVTAVVSLQRSCFVIPAAVTCLRIQVLQHPDSLFSAAAGSDAGHGSRASHVPDPH